MNLTNRASLLADRAVEQCRTAWNRLLVEARQIVDLDRWRTGATWRERVEAVSWPRASIAGGLVTVLGVGLWLIAMPSGIHAHPPRLPTQVELEAARSAERAMHAELSPALAAANRTETTETHR